MEIGQLLLEEDVGVRGAGDVARAARARSDALEGLGHGLQHDGMLAHAEVVVGAPDRHVDRAVGAVPGGAGEVPAVALDIGEDAVAAFRAQPGEGVDQRLFVPDARRRARLPGTYYNTRAVRALDRLADDPDRAARARARRALFRAVERAEAARRALPPPARVGPPAVPHPIALTPFLVSRRALPGLAHLAALVHRVQAHAPALWRADAEGFRELCPVSERTAEWLACDPAAIPRRGGS